MSISHLPKTVVNMCFDEVSKISQDTTVYNMVDIDCFFVCLVVFNATFNNISVISWRCELSQGNRKLINHSSNQEIRIYDIEANKSWTNDWTWFLHVLHKKKHQLFSNIPPILINMRWKSFYIIHFSDVKLLFDYYSFCKFLL
jgi:hypothetical protein